MTALTASPRPLSEPHPLLALEKNNFRADAQPTRDGHEHRRRIPIIAIDGLPALASSLSTARTTARPHYRLNHHEHQTHHNLPRARHHYHSLF